MRPCRHNPSNTTCKICWRCQDLSDPVNKLYRDRWGEPEPDSPLAIQSLRTGRRKCKHLGDPTGEMVGCGQCGASEKTKLKVFKCELWQECTPDTVGRRVVDGKANYLPNCKTCKQYDPGDVPDTTSDFAPNEKDPLDVRSAQPGASRNLQEWLAYSPTSIREHNLAFKELLQRDFKPPTKAEGRGLILCGGERYWPMLLLSLKMFRDVCDLPVQVWHRGDDEPIPYQDLDGIPNVTVHDAYATTPRPRLFYDGNNTDWVHTIKTHALVHCGWEQALYLDADAYILRDPTPLFNLLDQTGFVYWPSRTSSGQKNLWNFVDVKSNGMPNVQGGQYLIDRKRLWRELLLTYWQDQHADYFYRYYQSNDEDSWRVTFSATRTPCHCIDEMEWREVAWLCKLDKQDFIAHRCGSKLWLHSQPSYHPRLPREGRVFEILAQMGFDRYSIVNDVVKVSKLKLLA